MANDQGFVDFVMDQIEDSCEASYRHMFGGTSLYVNGIEDEIENAEWLSELIVRTERELPAPRPKKKRRKKGSK